MCRCVLCGEWVEHEGRFVLCGECRRQVCAMKAEDKRYWWFAGAVKRGMDLFSSEKAVS